MISLAEAGRNYYLLSRKSTPTFSKFPYFSTQIRASLISVARFETSLNVTNHRSLPAMVNSTKSSSKEPTIKMITGALGGVKTSIKKAQEVGQPASSDLLAKQAKLEQQVKYYNERKLTPT